MSTYESETEAKAEPEPEAKADPDSNDLYSIVRETLFILGVLTGMTVFAFGFAFFLLGVTTDTVPPAPYFATTTDRILLIAISVIALIGGGVIVRKSMSIAGW